MSEGLQDALLLALCLAGLLASWISRIREEEQDKAAERGKRNFGRSA
jgi:Zn-dependent protease with chaperone function